MRASVAGRLTQLVTTQFPTLLKNDYGNLIENWMEIGKIGTYKRISRGRGVSVILVIGRLLENLLDQSANYAVSIILARCLQPGRKFIAITLALKTQTIIKFHLTVGAFSSG